LEGEKAEKYDCSYRVNHTSNYKMLSIKVVIGFCLDFVEITSPLFKLSHVEFSILGRGEAPFQEYIPSPQRRGD
jgi:hypothetical protein